MGGPGHAPSARKAVCRHPAHSTLGFGGSGAVRAAEPDPDAKAKPADKTVLRVATCQAKRCTIDRHLKTPAEALAAVDKNLDEPGAIVHKAGDAKCDALTLPEDTLGLLDWGGENEAAAKDVLPEAVKRMTTQLGRAAAKHRVYLVVCSVLAEAGGKTYNTAFLLGRDDKEVGRYHKACPTWGEAGSREQGTSFLVFPTTDLGTVEMLVCYDLVFPETARCPALPGAGVICVQALRVWDAESHVYLIVAHCGSGKIAISPRGKILAKAEGLDGLAVADIDPRGGRGGATRPTPRRTCGPGSSGSTTPRRSRPLPTRTRRCWPRCRSTSPARRPHLRPDADHWGGRFQAGVRAGPRGQDGRGHRRVREAAGRLPRDLGRPRRR